MMRLLLFLGSLLLALFLMDSCFRWNDAPGAHSAFYILHSAPPVKKQPHFEGGAEGRINRRVSWLVVIYIKGTARSPGAAARPR